MKKLLLIFVLVCFAGLNQLFAANPIPSYNVLVTGRASFLESTIPFLGNVPSDARRQMNVQTSTASPSARVSSSIVVVKIYRLDGLITKGPYYLICGQSLSVGIDDYKWGVEVKTEVPARVSVWASSE